MYTWYPKTLSLVYRLFVLSLCCFPLSRAVRRLPRSNGILKMFLKYSHNFPNNLLKFKQCDHESKETKRKNIANKNSNNNGSVDIKNKILQFSLNHIVYVRDFTFFSLVSSVNDDTIRVNIWFIIEYINRFEFSNAKKLHAIRANKRFK